jgi:hypothetical protein
MTWRDIHMFLQDGALVVIIVLAWASYRRL